MTPYLSDAQGEKIKPAEVDKRKVVRIGAEEEENVDCILEQIDGKFDNCVHQHLIKRRIDTFQSYEYPESSTLIIAGGSTTSPMASIGAPDDDSTSGSSLLDMMTSDELEESSPLFDEHSYLGFKKKNKNNDWWCYLKRKRLLCNSSKSQRVNASRSLETCCLLVVGILLFALGLLGGRHIREHPRSTYHSPPIQSVVHDAIGKDNTTTTPQILVGTWYYPWYNGDFHRGDGYVRKLLHQRPSLGEYNDRDPKTISQHLHWSRQGNIGLWVTSWWGPYTRVDNTTRTVILQHKELQKGEPYEHHKIALFYETFGRIRKEEQYSLDHIRPDMEFICEHYLTHPNYYTLDGRPVLFMYLTRLLDTLVRFESVIRMIRHTVKDICGKDIYIVGDQVFGRFDDEVSAEQRLITEEDKDNKLYSSAPTAFDLLDGVTGYDVYGSMTKVVGSSGGYQTEASVTEYYMTEQRKWRNFAKEQKGCSFIPSVAPGYNDLGVRPEKKHAPLSRSLQQDRQQSDGNNDHGSFFRVSLEKARTLVDPSASYLLMVNSFNEWHEDTQIEPASGKSTSKPYNLTHGIEYHGYETLYLDILRNATKNVNIAV